MFYSFYFLSPFLELNIVGTEMNNLPVLGNFAFFDILSQAWMKQIWVWVWESHNLHKTFGVELWVWNGPSLSLLVYFQPQWCVA